MEPSALMAVMRSDWPLARIGLVVAYHVRGAHDAVVDQVVGELEQASDEDAIRVDDRRRAHGTLHDEPALRADPRPDHRRRAGSARAVSSLLLVVPIVFFTNALALQTQRAERAAYVASESYVVHQRMAQDASLDSMVQMEAAANLERAAEVKTARMDGTWFASLIAAIFVYGTLGWAGTALYKPRPETAWEAKERQHQRKLAQERDRRAERRRARDAEIKAMEKAAAKPFDLMAHLRPN